MKLGLVKKIRTILLVVACISFCVGLALSQEKNKERAHNPKDIEIEIIDCESGADNRSYYVNLEYKITNDTKEELYCVNVTASFKDKNGDLIGTVTSTHGSQMGYAALKLGSDESTKQQVQLSEYQSASSYDDIFVELYNNGIEDMEIEYEITYVKWSDGYEYRK